MSHKKRYYSFIRSLLPVILSIFLGGGTIALAALTIGGTSITSDGALSIIAGGTDQNITLAPSPAHICRKKELVQPLVKRALKLLPS